MKMLRTLRKKLVLFRNRIRVTIQIDKTAKKLVFPDTWKKSIKYIGWGINVVSWAFAIVTLPPVYAILVSIIFTAISWLVGRNLFFYRSMVDLSGPTDFEINHSGWLGMLFSRTDYGAPLVAFICRDDEYAHQVQGMLSGWAGGKTRDVTDNISLSAINLKHGGYVLYCYPNLNGPDIEKFHSIIEKKKKETDPYDHHSKFFFLPHIAKTFPEPNPDTKMFFEYYEEGIPLILTFLVSEGQGVRNVTDIDMMILSTMKIKHIDDLTRHDPEYGFIEVLGTFEKEAMKSIHKKGYERGFVQVDSHIKI